MIPQSDISSKWRGVAWLGVADFLQQATSFFSTAQICPIILEDQLRRIVMAEKRQRHPFI